MVTTTAATGHISFQKFMYTPGVRDSNVTGVGSPERISMRTSAGVSSDASGGGGTVGSAETGFSSG